MIKQQIEIDSDFEAILMCAVRYSLGRQTYMPKLVVDYIEPLLDKLSYNTLSIMHRDLTSNVAYYGSETIDKPMWLSFADKIKKEMNSRDDLCNN